jgi:uncharacterized protein
MSGQVVHFEIPADDVERAKSFYAEAFGWQIQSMPEVDYNMVATGPTNEQGMPTEPGSINGDKPVITIAVDDIDATLKQIESLGGSTAAPKMAVMDMGFAAYFNDSEGNLLGLWQNAG